MYAFVYGKTCNLAEVVVGMCADGADSVWAEGKRFGLPSVNLAEFLFAEHSRVIDCTNLTIIPEFAIIRRISALPAGSVIFLIIWSRLCFSPAVIRNRVILSAG